MSKRAITIGVVGAIITATGVFYLATLRPGHDWGGDFALYIHHAQNIAQGKPYSDTGFIFNPYYANLSPDRYPPVFPLMLAPICKAWGMDLMAMKVEVVVCFVLALVAIWLVLRNELPAVYAVSLLGILAFNPWFWDFKDQILSDIPFMFFMYGALFWLHRAYTRWEAGKKPCLDAMLAGLFVCLTCGTRSIGLALVLAAIGHDLIRYRKPTRILVIVLGMFGLFAILQSILVPSQTSYLSLFSWDTPGILAKILYFPLTDLWSNGYETRSNYIGTLTFTLTCIITVLAIAGYVIRVRRRITVLELLGPVYMIPLMLVQAFQGMRYLIPLAPLYAFYTFVALSEWKFLQRNDVKKTLSVGLCIAIFGSYIARYTTLDFGPIIYGPEKPESQELFDFVRNNTDPNDVIVFRKPRVLSLYTDRPSSVTSRATRENSAPLWDHVKSIHARYIIAGPFIEDHQFLNPILRESGSRLEQVFVNNDFQVYRIKD